VLKLLKLGIENKEQPRRLFAAKVVCEDSERHRHVWLSHVRSALPWLGQCRPFSNDTRSVTPLTVLIMPWVQPSPCVDLFRPASDVAATHVVRSKLAYAAVDFFLGMLLRARLADYVALRGYSDRNVICGLPSEEDCTVEGSHSCQSSLWHFDFDAEAERAMPSPSPEWNAQARSPWSLLEAGRLMLFRSVLWPALLMDVWSLHGH
jgi:hypothetical protein